MCLPMLQYAFHTFKGFFSSNKHSDHWPSTSLQKARTSSQMDWNSTEANENKYESLPLSVSPFIAFFCGTQTMGLFSRRSGWEVYVAVSGFSKIALQRRWELSVSPWADLRRSLGSLRSWNSSTLGSVSFTQTLNSLCTSVCIQPSFQNMSQFFYSVFRFFQTVVKSVVWR